MGNIILNTVAIIFMFGVVGYLLVINHRWGGFLVLTDWSIVMSECPTVGDLCRVMGYIFNAIITTEAIMDESTGRCV